MIGEPGIFYLCHLALVRGTGSAVADSQCNGRKGNDRQDDDSWSRHHSCEHWAPRWGKASVTASHCWSFAGVRLLFALYRASIPPTLQNTHLSESECRPPKVKEDAQTLQDLCQQWRTSQSTHLSHKELQQLVISLSSDTLPLSGSFLSNNVHSLS